MKEKSKLDYISIIKKALPALLLILGTVFLTISGASKEKDSTEIQNNDIIYDSQYAVLLENKLTDVLEKVTGKGTVKVMITFENTYETHFEDEIYDSTAFVFSENEKSEVSIVKKPVPEIGGVMIVCSSIKEKSDFDTIKKAAATALNIQEQKIYVIGGASQQ